MVTIYRINNSPGAQVTTNYVTECKGQHGAEALQATIRSIIQFVLGLIAFLVKLWVVAN